ncbi:MAG: endonuclease III [Clostridiales bacterium]|jgi:endonuclease-3|nr:endonuclease III [Clostridiales bacterium]
MTHELSEQIIQKISTVVPNANCELEYQNPYQLLVAVVLSAQCTDVRVNKVARELFEVASTPLQMVQLDEVKLQQILRPLGFFRAKAKSILTLSKQLLDKHDGIVPQDREQLQALQGVGRKTANVVLMEVFKQPVIAVDTHVFRVSRRLLLSSSDTPKGVENDLYENLPKHLHLKAHQTILHFGRYFCKAQRPLCERCVVKQYCTYLNIGTKNNT